MAGPSTRSVAEASGPPVQLAMRETQTPEDRESFTLTHWRPEYQPLDLDIWPLYIERYLEKESIYLGKSECQSC